MTLLLITGKGGETAPDTANRDVARAQQLARHIDDLVVLEADETWWNPVGARMAEISWRSEPVDWDPDVRRSSLARVLRETAKREPGTVVLLLDADLDLVKRIHPLAQKLDLPLLWWHEEPPSEAVVTEVRHHVAGLLTSWTDHAAVPGWLWSVGAGIDLQAVPLIETFPARPPLRLLAWALTGRPDLNGLLQTFAFARGLNADAHLTIALTDSGLPNGQRHLIEAQIRNLALTRSAHITVVDGPGGFPGMLAQAHALVDVQGPDDALTLAALLAMAHGRPVLSSREQFAKLLETAPLPLRFAPGDERQLADRIRSVAAAWSEELDTAGQRLRDAARQEHSVAHWADGVASIVGFVRTQRQAANEPAAWEPSAELAAFTGNGSSAPPPSSEQPEPDAPNDALNGGDRAEESSDDSSEEATVGRSRWRRRRSRRSGNR
ncbi:MAG: hypothetical protein QOF40_1216 [Actinomycetota bacterium]|nr:hypothetical protein [Actinomycetota bacterium]